MKQTKKFRKLLIANRGEIAVRIIRACRELNIQTVAVYSECDRLSPHVRWANEAYCVGGSPATESYLRVQEILSVAKSSNAEAIHPGYGFFSESPEFRDACQENGIFFIGPKGSSMRVSTDKICARQTARQLGIPTVPGVDRPIKNLEDALESAKHLGYPVLLKPRSGRAGAGIQTVDGPEQMDAAFQLSTSEAQLSSGDPCLFMEKLLKKAHHVEVQILGDQHGKTVSLGEKECSIQRNRQKIIEETPSPFIGEETRKKITEDALLFAREIEFEGVGTVEFIIDEYQNHIFIEMNPGLQVDHAVTEQATGIDIVRSQIKVAMGCAIASFLGRPVEFHGHALECHINAEDPTQEFFPSPGKILKLLSPSGPGIRVDTACSAGTEIPPYYDTMVAKLIAWGPTRKKAMQKMKRALQEFEIHGLKTNLPFLQNILMHPDFRSGHYDTNFISTQMLELIHPKPGIEETIAAIAAYLYHEKFSNGAMRTISPKSNELSLWKLASRREAFRNAS